MADIYFPSDLEIVSSGYSSQDQNGVIRTDMDAGPAKTRLRYTACSEYLNCKIVANDSELSEFLTFFRTTIKRGALRFIMPHPVTGENRYCRIMEPPVVAEESGLWNIGLKLEVLP